MNSAHQALYEALADAAGSGRSLGPEWEGRLDADPKLRSIAERFDRITATLGELPALDAPGELEGRVVSTLQAGNREDRAVETLRGLSTHPAPPELEALVAESLPGVTQLEAPPELDQRIEALLRDWGGMEEAEEGALTTPPGPRSTRRRLLSYGLATAASLLFIVAIAMPRKSAHEQARDDLVQSVEVIKAGATIDIQSPIGGELLNGVTGGVSDFAARRKAPTKTVKPRMNLRVPAGNGGQGAGRSPRGGVGTQGGSQSSNTSGGAAADGSGADLLTKLSDSNVPAHEGDRVVRLAVSPDSPIVLIYREHVSVADDGTFAVDPIEVIQPQMAPENEDLFLLLQKSRESFVHRYRGFRIATLALFTEQYTTVQSFNSAIISGKECVELDIQPNAEEGHSYHLWVEPVSGVCLMTHEFDSEGRLVIEIEYENIDFAPTFISTLSGGTTGWASMDQGPSASQVLTPLWVPEGYVLQGTEAYTDSQGGEWIRLRYTDGVETLFVLQGEEQGASQGSARGPAKGALTQVFVHKVGSWTAAEGSADGRHFVVMGKRPEADLVATLASTVP